MSFYSYVFNFSYIIQLEGVVDNLRKNLEEKQKEMAAWKAKYNIRTAEEVEAARKQQASS